MSFNEEYNKLRKKRLEEEQKQDNSFKFVSGPYQNATLTANDIAPVVNTKTVVIDDVDDIGKKNKGSGLFKAGTFADGYQFGDVAGAILGTVADTATGIVQGAAGIGEGLGDLVMYGVAGVQDLLGYDDDADRLREATKDDIIAPLFDSFRKKTNIDDSSLLGDFGYGVAQGVGQVGAMIATAGIGGAPLSMGMIGGSSMGSGMSEAYKGGATDGEALAYGTMKGVIDVGTEMIFGGLGKTVKALGISKGLTSIDDVFAKKLSSKISNQFFKNATQYGVKATAEGLEEVLAGLGSAVAKNLTYMSEEDLQKLVEDENLLEQFAAGALVSGIAQTGDLVKSTKQGRDFITNFTSNEEKVIEKEVENRVTEKEQDGTKLTKKEKNEIYEQVQKDIKKGYISTDTIESVLGGESYEKYKEAADRDTKLNEEYEALNKEYEDLYKMKNGEKSDEQIDRQADLKNKLVELKEKIDSSDLADIKSDLFLKVFDSLTQKDKNGKTIHTDRYLKESFYEVTRRSEAFEADLSKYNDKTAETVKRAIDSGILNNTRRTHEFVDMIAKISTDKGVLFDFTNNAKLKESSFAIDGKDVNGYITKDGITINIDSSKATNTIVGHEITHVLEGTELYGELQKAIFDYAKTKGEYHKRRADLVGLYKNVEGVDYSAELTADLVGDYLFTDEAFINNLSTKHRNVFQKIYDEIKYLYKLASAGSKEARELEKVKRAFDKAYKESGKVQSYTKYSLSDSDGKKLTKEQSEYFKDSKMRDENGNLKVMYHGSQDAGFHVFDASMSDDDTSFFFVDSNDVAASYSGTSETYEAQTIRTAEDMNNFIESIGAEGYEVVEKDGKFTLLYEGDRVADSNTPQGIYEEFCWYEGVGEGDANYKVYLNLTNPLEVDAEGRNWNNISREFSQEVYGRYKSLTAEEKAALSNLAEWGEYSIFRDEMLEARATAEQGGSGVFDEAYTKNLARAYAKLGGANANLYDAFSIAQENFSEESLKEFAVKQMNTRDYARKAKAEGYDGVIFKNIVDNGGYSNGSEGTSTVAIAFESNQIKSVANEKPTSNPDIRFSLSKPIEETKDLLVLHNLSESKLIKQLKLDGFPMPSLAVTNQPHTTFGSISILFDKDTIDPKKNKKNKTYSADAWTPTFPKIEYEANSDISHNFIETLQELIDDSRYKGDVNTFLYDVEDSLNRNDGYEGFIDYLAEKPSIQYAFLKSKGENIEIAQKAKEVDLGFSNHEKWIERYESLIADFSGDISNLGKIPFNELVEQSPTLKNLLDRYPLKGKMQQLNLLSRVINEAQAYQSYDPNAVVETEYIPDYSQTDKDIRARIDTNELKAWLKEQTNGIVANSGVRNGKDIFTPSGNRRSFQQLHIPVTVENIVKSMATQGEKSVTGFNGVKTLRATTAKTFKSIAEIQKAKGKLQSLSEAEIAQIQDELYEQMYETFNKIIDENPTKFRQDDIFVRDHIGEVLSEVEYDNINASYIKGVFNKYGYNMSSETADACFKLLDAISSMPVNIFEAKPQRVVGYDEIKAIILPDNTSIELKNALTEREINFVEYDGTEADRQAKLNEVATANDSYFSLSAEGETPKRYGNYNIFGEDIKLEAPTQEDIAPVDEVAPITEDTEAKPIMQAKKSALAEFTKKKTYSGGYNFQGAYNADGKQYLSDGKFAVEFTDIDESIPHNKDFPIAKIQNILNEAIDGQANEKYSIDFDRIVEINNANKGKSVISVITVGGTPFDAKYIEAVMRAIPNSTFALSDFRGGIKALVAVGENGRAILMPVRAGDKFKIAYAAQKIKPTLETVAPMPNEPTIYDLEQKQAKLEDTIRKAMANNDPNAPKLIDEYGELLDTIAKRKKEESAIQRERFESLDDADAPPEMEAPYYGENENIAPENPFEDRDIKAVGNRQVKAYMYENPEVKPFFQEEANRLLGELREGTKGEKFYTEVEGGVPGAYGSDSYGVWSGTKRHVSADIEYLLDTLHLSYADIEKGINAIIEDNGKENNAASKRIEFILNDRLLKGYTDFIHGYDIPPNQDYINLLNEKQITEYSEEARAKFFEEADQYAPPMEDIAPMAENTTVNEPKINKPIEEAPIAEAYEAIKPKNGKSSEPRLKRVQASDLSTGGIEPPKVAEILTKEPITPKKKNRAFTQARTNLLDKGSVFEDLSLKTGNRELQAKYNFMHYSEARAQKYIAERLKPIVDKVEQSGKTEQLYEYVYHLHNIDRMSLETAANQAKREAIRKKFKGYSDKQIEHIASEAIKRNTPKDIAERIKVAREYVEAGKVKNKPVFDYSVTADVSKSVVKDLEAENPEFKDLSKEIIAYNEGLRQMLVDKGVISQETADLWAKMYPHYVPIRRLGDEGLSVNVPLDTRKTGINAPIKRATGGNRDILPLFDTMAMRTEQTFKAIAKNSFGTELMHTLGPAIDSNATSLDEMIESVEKHEELLQAGGNGKNPTFTVFENGKKVTFEISEEMYDALKPTSKGLSYTNKVANTASNIFRGIVTEYNPVFMVSNAAKDIQDVLINSQHAVKTYANIPKAIKELTTKGKWHAEYMANGGEQNTYFDSESKTFKEENKGFVKTIGMPIRAISTANNFIERVPRLAEYIASRESGASVEVAMLDAARVTTNFAAGGDVTKFLNRNGATFLNASVQGFNQNVRNIREAKANGLKGWVKLAAKVALAGLPALLLNNLLWDDDEEYEELSEYVKDKYYIVAKTEDGKFIRIPKGRVAAVIQDAFEQINNAITGNDEVDFKNFFNLVISNLAPNNPIENNILAPIIQVANNKTWYGEDLVPTRLQDLPAAEQFDESTDAISKWLGEKANISPYKLNYLLNQYSGGVGDVFLPMMTPEAESGDNSFRGNMLAPMKDKFTTDSILNNKNVSDFYDTMDELTTNAKSSKATDEDILKYKYFNSVNAELGELYAQKREIQNSDLADNEKYEAVLELQEQINDLARESLNTYENVYISDGYASIGDIHYRWYEPGEDSDAEAGWQKITDKQLEKQEAVTSYLGVEPSEYWKNKTEYDFAYEYPEKYSVAKSIGGYSAYKRYTSDLYDIKADKDKYGKSISGSRKEKVIEYVNNLDIDYGARLILFKSEYKADDTYNYDIIDYLNNRQDISYEEMEIILKELGFTVLSDGRIFWD